MAYAKAFLVGCLVGAFINVAGQRLFWMNPAKGKYFSWAFFCWETTFWGLFVLGNYLMQGK